MSELTSSELESKRFAVTTESMELMNKTKLAFLEQQKEKPYLSGISFFGSRTKGLEKQTSDLDVIIFYDSNKFSDPDESHEDQFLDVKNKISEAIGVELGSHSGWNKNLSLEKTDIDLYNYMNFVRKLRGKPTEEIHKILSSFPEAQNLFSRFFLGVGDGLYKNRKYILDQLSIDGNGDEQFSLLMGALSVFERDNRTERAEVPNFSGLPKTIESARQYFLTEPRLT